MRKGPIKSFKRWNVEARRCGSIVFLSSYFLQGACSGRAYELSRDNFILDEYR